MTHFPSPDPASEAGGTGAPGVRSAGPPVGTASTQYLTSEQVPAGQPVSAATRHLCAGAYLDDDFRRSSLNEVYYQPRRMVAPSYGFDLTTVLGYCLRARAWAVARDAAICGILVIGLCAGPIPLLVTIGTLVMLSMVTSTYRVLREAARDIQSGRPVSVGKILVLLVRNVSAAVVLFVIFGLVTVVSTAAAFAALSGEDGFTLLVAPVAAAFLLVAVLAVPVTANLWRQRRLDRLAPGWRPAAPARSSRFDDIHRQQAGNTIIYSGYWPFVGSGHLITTWGFAQRLIRAGSVLSQPKTEAEREFVEPPFSAEQIISYVRGQLRTLVDDPLPERRLPGLALMDQVFLAGTEASYLTPHTDPQRISEIIREPVGPARHYLACQVVSWNGELVTTVYVHISVQGRSLYVDLTSAALAPCDERFRIVDQVGGTGTEAYLRVVGRGIVDAPRIIGLAPVNLLREAFGAIRAGLDTRPAGSSMVLGYDYGARVSVRELGTPETLRNDAQRQDIDKYHRIIERKVLAAILDFLSAYDVDVSEFQQRALTILNAGAVNTGSGSMSVYGNAVGSQNLAFGGRPAPPSGAQ